MLKVCRNCRKNWREGDRYCRYCGAPLDEPDFIPEQPAARIYGPRPIPRKHLCARCGHSWETRMMVDREDYCPRCGGEAPGHPEPEGGR